MNVRPRQQRRQRHRAAAACAGGGGGSEGLVAEERLVPADGDADTLSFQGGKAKEGTIKKR